MSKHVAELNIRNLFSNIMFLQKLIMTQIVHIIGIIKYLTCNSILGEMKHSSRVINLGTRWA
jgi:hypothetical protein